ncbi:hypothetical protein SCG7086_AN_00230 [Chlamydiales bacterium SCGC AG-110-P3]|nr:hypothetical protein SCG7086_AN_00230 [Chlamydiales bacterium SCGC AG-110-P3]
MPHDPAGIEEGHPMWGEVTFTKLYDNLTPGRLETSGVADARIIQHINGDSIPLNTPIDGLVSLPRLEIIKRFFSAPNDPDTNTTEGSNQFLNLKDALQGIIDLIEHGTTVDRLDIEGNPIPDPDNPGNNLQIQLYATTEIASKFDLLLKSLLAAGLDIGGAANGVATNEAIARWKNIGRNQDLIDEISRMIGTVVVDGTGKIDTAQLGYSAISMQRMLEVGYVQQGTDLIFTDMEQLRQRQLTTKDAMEILTGIQTLHNKIIPAEIVGDLNTAQSFVVNQGRDYAGVKDVGEFKAKLDLSHLPVSDVQALRIEEDNPSFTNYRGIDWVSSTELPTKADLEDLFRPWLEANLTTITSTSLGGPLSLYYSGEPFNATTRGTVNTTASSTVDQILNSLIITYRDRVNLAGIHDNINFVPDRLGFPTGGVNAIDPFEFSPKILRHNVLLPGPIAPILSDNIGNVPFVRKWQQVLDNHFQPPEVFSTADSTPNFVTDFTNYRDRLDVIINKLQAEREATPNPSAEPEPGTLEFNLVKIRESMGDTSATGIRNWIIDSWPSSGTLTDGISDRSTIQNDIKTGITAAANINDEQKEELRKTLFIFEEFYKSASALLSKITQIIEKLAGNISR